MRARYYWIGTLLLLGLGGCQRHVSLSKVNFDYCYNLESPVGVQHKVLDAGDRWRIFLALDMRKLDVTADLATLYERYQFAYRVVGSYRSRRALDENPALVFSEDVTRSADGTFHVRFSLLKPAQVPTVLVLDVQEKSSGNSFAFDIPLPGTQFDNPEYRYGIFPPNQKWPRYAPYLTTRDTISLNAFERQEPQLQVAYYPEPFRPALPPMAPANEAPQALQMQMRYQIGAQNLLMFSQPGLYFAQEDTTHRAGFGFVVADHRFPRVTRAEELVDPLIYITTRDERNRLVNATDPKLALDEFWLKLGGSRDQARQLIRAYYRRVQQANDLFTNFKEGWKTDPGMIYVVFGKPDRVARKDDREEWYYVRNANLPEVVFTFVRRPTIFTDQNLELLRYNEYDQAWYTMVEQWRKGILRN